MRTLMLCLQGFTGLVHENRDFYADVKSGQVPEYDILITNPPYSADHKERILAYVRGTGKPWALLLPNYVATKQYYTEMLVTGQPIRPQQQQVGDGQGIMRALKGYPPHCIVQERLLLHQWVVLFTCTVGGILASSFGYYLGFRLLLWL